VVALVDRRARADIGVRSTSFRTVTEAAIARVDGSTAVRGCTVVSVDAGGRPVTFDCDSILSAGGHAPAVHLHSQAGGKLRWLADSAMFVPDGHAPGLVSVGACAGIFDREAAAEHAAHVGRALGHGQVPPVARPQGAGRSLASTLLPGMTGKQFVDLQNDVAVGDVDLAARENYRSVEHLKRYTTTGMGTDQGKTSNVNALVLMGDLTGRQPAEVGTTKFRPPFAPVTLGLMAGRRVGALYRPLKSLPAERWHQARGALFEQFGSWYRPAAYPLIGETLDIAAQREARAVRTSVGVLDGSPLGKLEVFGPDAAEFLDLMYVGTMSTLSIGQARYGVLLNENGIVADDGIVARLSEAHYWVNTTSARVTAGLGTIARVVASGETIYRGKLAFAEAERRIETCWKPFHETISALIDGTRAVFGQCVLIDCHSMPSHVPVSGRGDRMADIILGDAHGTACAPHITRFVERRLVDLGYRVRRNDPYAGGFITRHYGRPREHVHALQIEIARDLYMDEARFERSPAFPEVQRDVSLLIEALAAEVARPIKP